MGYLILPGIFQLCVQSSFYYISFMKIFISEILSSNENCITEIQVWALTAAFSQTRYQPCHTIYLSSPLIIKTLSIQSLVNIMFSEHFMGKWKRGYRSPLLTRYCIRPFSQVFWWSLSQLVVPSLTCLPFPLAFL